MWNFQILRHSITIKLYGYHSGSSLSLLFDSVIPPRRVIPVVSIDVHFNPSARSFDLFLHRMKCRLVKRTDIPLSILEPLATYAGLFLIHGNGHSVDKIRICITSTDVRKVTSFQNFRWARDSETVCDSGMYPFGYGWIRCVLCMKKLNNFFVFNEVNFKLSRLLLM